MKRPRLLLAEDNPAHQRLLTLALMASQPEAELQTVMTGGEVSQQLRNHRYDCIILDYNLPDISASELLRACEPDLGSCPSVVVSSSSDQSVAIESFRSGSVDFIPKAEAFLGDALWRRVDQAIRNRRRVERERRLQQRMRRRLEMNALTDPLTGLRNRRFLDELIRSRDLRRDRRKSLACLIVDVDRFKGINDEFGHLAGDEVLRVLGRLLRRSLRPEDCAVRYGGEEFCILLGSSDTEAGWCWADRLREELSKATLRIADRPLKVTVSIGVSSGPPALLADRLIDQADRALYLAKSMGRDRVCSWEMAVVEDAVRAAASSPGGVRLRRVRFLRALGDALGPTQRRHVRQHCRLAERFAGALARSAGLPEIQVERIRQAALLHDVGKCLVPDSLLARLGGLDHREYVRISQARKDGALIAAALGADDQIADWIAAAAEPDLADAATPMEIRLVALADALAAMLADRPDRKAMEVERVTDWLRTQGAARYGEALVLQAVQCPELARRWAA